MVVRKGTCVHFKTSELLNALGIRQSFSVPVLHLANSLFLSIFVLADKMEISNGAATPHGPIQSILDTDLYKLTMQQAVLTHFSDVHVAYKFTNRSQSMRFTRASVAQIQQHIDGKIDSNHSCCGI